MTWFLLKSFGLPRYLWAVLAVGALVALVLWLRASENADDKANQEVGAAVQREGDLQRTLERVETGNATREEIIREVDRGNGDVLYAQCLRTARTPANCERFLLTGETPVR
jgi:hypothetical protein